jgi:hypothetical protein
MAYQSFTNTCGLLNLTKPRDDFLKNLCQFALPKNVIRPDDHISDIIRDLTATLPASSSSSTGSSILSGLAALSGSSSSSGGSGSNSGAAGSGTSGTSGSGSGAGPTAAAAAAAASSPLLTPKNIQSLKALFNIAHCLGGLLGNAWHTILETFESLDAIIQVSTELAHRLERYETTEKVLAAAVV